ncbi:endonuclease/exonuclease/phosphatase family protein [Phaeocystidibacter marisrubri]|uniref:T9SS type A sorting domain-containing protein n=1 Tax=Phaeocystidibacter marisrubri TaxID=1577780 RepID=A0A6L3ZCC5_9FLAO|nr:endonuclease/exonuclease/phosphatase family protein [Phaeocystidibacter marisrubri]KAB2815296.1 T9SS type A sorting domain-containing protein [Phaeocystidibacter marisrubri]GGH71358.1 hypothetical protein GCM10011318_14290 [Phaeocystidibacter marisrubri]
MKKVYGLFLLVCGFNLAATAQNSERLKIMTYNLLNYRNTTSYCDGSNNSSSQKDTYLHTIVNHVEPHILVCQEVGAQSGVPADRILTNALNTGSTQYWAKAAYTNNGFSNIVNAAFYDTRYVGLKSQSHITQDASNNSLARVIDFYRFYYKDSLLSNDPDTVFFTVVGVHLKAGSTTSDQNQRTAAALATMQYIQSSVVDDNVILCGDLNMNAGSDAAFQHFINYSVAGVRLYDPMNETGTWYNNYGVRYIHTQSTRLSNTNSGCFSGGGLDDRYDHILVSDEILNGAEGIEMTNGTFTVIGNDGLHLNQDITDNSNLSVPSNVLTALHGMSDHLPVTLEFDVEKKNIGLREAPLHETAVRISQLTPNTVRIEWPLNVSDIRSIEITDLHGRCIHTSIPDGNAEVITLSRARAGVYVARLTRNNGELVHAKFMIR